MGFEPTGLAPKAVQEPRIRPLCHPSRLVSTLVADLVSQRRDPVVGGLPGRLGVPADGGAVLAGRGVGAEELDPGQLDFEVAEALLA